MIEIYRNADAIRHPELVSGSISPLNPTVAMARWMLKQVQHDGDGEAERNLFASSRLRANPMGRRPSEGWGPSRLSTEPGASWKGGISPRLRGGHDMFFEVRF